MSPDDGRTAPKVGDLIHRAVELLQSFDPSTLTYLGADGNWKTDPKCPRDRISNELWFRIWQVTNKVGFEDELGRLFQTALQDEDRWDFINRAFSPMITVAVPGRADLLIFAELLYHIIEYDALKTNSEGYTAEWDSLGKLRRTEFADRADRFLQMLSRLFRCAEGTETFLVMYSRAKTMQIRIVLEVSRVIGEEERLRWQLKRFMRGLDGDVSASWIVSPTEQPSIAALLSSVTEAEALLRPCIEILADPEIAITSGMQFEASDLLGRLRDTRSLDVLVKALERLDREYTHLRANVTFAIGNLCHERSLTQLIRILEGSDYAADSSSLTSLDRRVPVFPEKREAMWAIGKLALRAVSALPVLKTYLESADQETRTYLAWAVGRMGSEQKRSHGSIDVPLVTILRSLVRSKDSAAFEEAAFALREIGMPHPLDALYPYDFEKISILSLKPSSTGLYELSETLLHLISLKRPVVMAVTGDSGTGKTYFCQTIAAGFAGVMSREILHLMRDRAGDKTLDMILGIRWLRTHVAPRFYEDYPLGEDKDNPSAFFEAFMSKHADKRLIILDGWRDEAYFNQVVDTFYDRGYMDVLVRFETTFSTRRINLEEREGSLESVRNHLSLVEEPAIEETGVYREGEVLVYNLDNSIPSRLAQTEIRAVFETRKVDTWGDQVRIGRFALDPSPLSLTEEELSSETLRFQAETETFGPQTVRSFRPAESSFTRVLNEHIEELPNLLETIEFAGMAMNRIDFYNQGQVACCGFDGTIGVLTGFNDRAFYTQAHDAEVTDIAVSGQAVCSIDTCGKFKITSFHSNSITELGATDVPASVISSHRGGIIATGHCDGTVRLWDRRAEQVSILTGHRAAILALTIDRSGRVYSAGEDMELRVWNLREGSVQIYGGHRSPIQTVGIYADGRVITGASCDDWGEKAERASGVRIRLIDLINNTCQTFKLRRCGMLRAMSLYFDGRIFLGTDKAPGSCPIGNLIVADPRPAFRQYSVLPGHAKHTRSCISMGPRIITCGSESSGNDALKIWGTAAYIEIEHSKRRLMPQGVARPPHYRSLF